MDHRPGPPSKRPRLAAQERKRAARACDRCRRLKEKCEGGEPCNRCLRSRHACEFNAIAPIEHVSDTGRDERTKYLEQIARHFLGDVSMSLLNLKRIAEKLETQTAGLAAEEGSDNEDLSLIEETFAVKTLSQNSAHYSGEFSHWNFSQKLRRRAGSLGSEANRGGELKVIEYWRASQLQSSRATVLAALECLPPWDIVEFLIQVYFEFAQTNSFYIEEKWLRNKIDVLKAQPDDISSDDSGWICSVVMVLAIGSQFSHMADERVRTAQGYVRERHVSSQPDIGAKFYQMGAKLLPDIITIASLESVQACLLLAHYTLPIDTHGLSYTYLGLALKLSIQNGMHRKYIGKDFNSHTIEVRNRLWWNVYTLERRICVLHGRPVSVSLNDVDADLPKDLPEFSSPGRESAFANMSALIHLTTGLGDISQAITLLRKCPRNLQAHYIERILDMRNQLHTWWDTVPVSKDRRSTHDKPMVRNDIHLNLCFLLNEIFMGRPFILLGNKTASPQESTPSPGNCQDPSKKVQGRSTLAAGAVKAALEVVSLCKSLHEHFGLAKASYTEFSAMRAALLVILAQSFNEHSDRLKTSLGAGMVLIRQMATDIDSAKSEVSVIESLEIAVQKLGLADKEPNILEDGSNQYGRFKSWAAAMVPTTSAHDDRIGYDFASLGTQAASESLGGAEPGLQNTFALQFDAFLENNWQESANWLEIPDIDTNFGDWS